LSDSPYSFTIACANRAADVGAPNVPKTVIAGRQTSALIHIMDAFAASWRRPMEFPRMTIKESCLERLILFGESSLRAAIQNFVAHYHNERNHQGLSNRVIQRTEITSETQERFSAANV
jgi:hypothetical protein